MSYETNDKMVSHPDHYNSGKYEVIDIIDEFCKDLTGTEAVCTANAIKYILRWKKKNGVQDLKKAVWYLTHLVEHLENEECEVSWSTDCNAYHMEDYTSGNRIKITEQEKAELASQGFKKIIIHHMDGRPNPREVIDISNLDDSSESGKEMFTPCVIRNICGNCKYFDVEHMNLNTGIGYCQYYSVPIHNQSISISYGCFEDRDKLSINDEPEPLNLRKNAADIENKENV